jgi:hypothetical protein
VSKSQDASGQDGVEAREPQITWVGEQRLMEGYCGRAPAAAAGEEPAANELRPIAVVKTRPGQDRVVRIGPPRAAAA